MHIVGAMSPLRVNSSREQSEKDVVRILTQSNRSAGSTASASVTSARVPSKSGTRKVELPAWFRSSGGLVAAFCACLVGMIPFCLIACMNLISIDDSEPQVLDTSIVVPTVAPLPPASVSEFDLMGTLSTFRQDLREQIQLHESTRQVSERAISMRMGSLEEKLAASIARQVDAPQVVTQVSSESVNLADTLGIDWAAWTAGAEIDHSHTSAGLGRNPAGRLMRAITGRFAPQWRSFASNVSQPPEVVLAADSSPPSRCFSFSGNGTLAIRLSRGVHLTHVVVEQLPVWAMTHAKATPRFFEVRATPSSVPADQYSVALGKFEYALDGKRAQAFALEHGTHKRWQAIQLLFFGNWGDDHTAVCRIRAMGPSEENA